MSDDTPTQRFDSAPDAPTELLAPPPGAPPSTPVTASGGSSKRTLVILLSVGGALLVAVLILLVVLLLRGSGPGVTPTPTPTDTSASPSPTPTETSASPTPTPTPTETVAPPPPPSPISAFTTSQGSVDCTGVSSVTVQFSWATTGQTLWFGVGTDNAKNAPFGEYPLNYTLDFDYQCGQSSGQQTYTITVESSGGALTSKSIIITE